jgi:hypothetical protein
MTYVTYCWLEAFFVCVWLKPMPPVPLRIHYRQIAASDIDGIVTLLTTGFRTRSRDFWLRALNRLTEHPTPPGFPKYGYLLESNGAAVGVLLLIFSAIEVNGDTRIRCNVSSWYVEPTYRSYAAMLVSPALKHKHVTYFNITPDPKTLPILEAQGYARYCAGRFVAVPMLATWSDGCHVQVAVPGICAMGDLRSSEIELLRNHANYGCISVICSSANRSYPFVFLPRRKARIAPFAYLAYCRHQEEFVRFAGPLGRFLARRGIPLVVLDSNCPVRGLVGRYFDDAPKYFKGPNKPRLGDMAYSERVMFGF